MSKFDQFIKDIENASVLELNELVKVIEEKFGVSATTMATAHTSTQSEGEAQEEKSTFTVVLASAGEQKIAVMKVVKEALSLGLKEAKDLVDSTPVTLKEGMKKAEVEEFKKKLEEAGAKVELK